MRNNKIYLGIFFCITIIGLIRCYEIREDILRSRFSNKNFYGEVGTWGYLADDIVKLIDGLIPMNEGEIAENIEKFQAEVEVGDYFGEATVKKPENVILIQLEGIDAITLDLMYDGKYVMPTMQELRNAGIYFSNAYDQSGSGRTSDGEFLALTSLLPIANESMYLQYDLNNLVSLPKILGEEGYKTISIHGYEGSFYNRRAVHASLGYQNSYFLEELQSMAKETDYLGWGLSDEFILKNVADMLCEAEESIFVHTILLTNHHPFNTIPVDYQEVLVKNPGSIVENYLNSVKYTDDVIGEFLKVLEETGELSESLIVIYSDHDSGITEEMHDYFELDYDVSNPEYDQIPLLVYGGNVHAREEIVSGQADIMPLILSYLNIDIPDTLMGMNYIGERKVVHKQGRDIYSDGTIDVNFMDMEQLTKSLIYYQKENE